MYSFLPNLAFIYIYTHTLNTCTCIFYSLYRKRYKKNCVTLCIVFCLSTYQVKIFINFIKFYYEIVISIGTMTKFIHILNSKLMIATISKYQHNEIN